MSVSPHGIGIAFLQFLAVLALLYAAPRIGARQQTRGWSPRRTTTLLAALLVLEYVVLRIQPIRMGGDPFAYSLGIFDAVSAFGLVMLLAQTRVKGPPAGGGPKETL